MIEQATVREMIAGGESVAVEFKRDDIRPEQLAREVVAMANQQGGTILLGVEDDGTLSGIKRDNLQEWIGNNQHLSHSSAACIEKRHTPCLCRGPSQQWRGHGEYRYRRSP